MQDFLSRHDRMQRLNTRPAPPVELDSYYSRHDDLYRVGNPLGALMLILIGMVMGMVVLAVVRKCDKEPVLHATHAPCQSCHSYQTAENNYLVSVIMGGKP